MDLVSVIVPVYNVERYLECCVNSIRKQSYTNLEIILVDDESPDNCPQLCDEWARCDSRIKVVHKKNGGLSDARNVGLKYANGMYVCFIDSDDYVSEKFIETLHNLIKLYRTEISAVSLREVFSMNSDKDVLSHSEVIVYEGEDALRELFSNNTFANYAWNKMYRRNLFDNIEFPVGRKMEDLGTTYKLLLEAKRIVFSSEQLYYYYQREDSILHQTDLKFYKDKFELSLERYLKIAQIYPEMIENNLFFLGVIFETYPRLYSLIKNLRWKEIAQNCYDLSKDRLSIKDKVKFFVLKNCGILYCFLIRKKHGHVKESVDLK